MALFDALSDPTRLAVVERLSRGSATVTELARPFPMALPTFSRHLKVLETAGLVTRRIEGRIHHIELVRPAVARLRSWLALGTDAGAVSALAPELRRRLFELPVRGTGPLDRDKAIANAEALLTELSPRMDVVALALASGTPSETFTPTAHAARRLAQRAAEDPDVAAQLQEALRLHTALSHSLDAVRAGQSIELLKAVIYPLSRLMFAWDSHPFLKDAFPLATAA